MVTSITSDTEFDDLKYVHNVYLFIYLFYIILLINTFISEYKKI